MRGSSIFFIIAGRWGKGVGEGRYLENVFQLSMFTLLSTHFHIDKKKVIYNCICTILMTGSTI